MSTTNRENWTLAAFVSNKSGARRGDGLQDQALTILDHAKLAAGRKSVSFTIADRDDQLPFTGQRFVHSKMFLLFGNLVKSLNPAALNGQGGCPL